MRSGRSKLNCTFVFMVALIIVLLLFCFPLAAVDHVQPDAGSQPQSIANPFSGTAPATLFGGARGAGETFSVKLSWFNAVILTIALILFNRYCETYAKRFSESITSKLAGHMSCEISRSLGANGPPGFLA